MNKTELIDWVAKNADLTRIAAGRAVDAFLEGITVSLQNDNPVVIVKWGTFVVKKRAAREGRNPITGEKIKINAAKVVGFKAGKSLKEAVKEGTGTETKS